jgi:hypothetical protein
MAGGGAPLRARYDAPMKTVAAALAVALVAGLVVQASAHAGSGPIPKIQVSKKPDGPFRSGVLAVGLDEKRNLFVRLKNKTNHRQNIGISEQCGGPGCANLSVKWFRGDNDVSHSVQAGVNGYEFKLKQDRPVTFRVKVIPESANPSACLYPLVSVDEGTPSDSAYFGFNGNLCN